MSNTININEFQPTPVLADLDLQIAQSNTLTGILSVNQATALVAGSSVVLDPAIASGYTPQFIAAAATDLAIGYIKRTVQAASFSAGDKVEIVGDFGPIMWFNANSTMGPGIPVQQNASDPTIVEAVSAGKTRGILLDPASAGQLVRVILTVPVAIAS